MAEERDGEFECVELHFLFGRENRHELLLERVVRGFHLIVGRSDLQNQLADRAGIGPLQRGVELIVQRLLLIAKGLRRGVEILMSRLPRGPLFRGELQVVSEGIAHGWKRRLLRQRAERGEERDECCDEDRGSFHGKYISFRST